MAFTNTPPDWDAAGTEPTSEMKSTGFVAGYKPPAAYFNWFWTKASKCIAELQNRFTSAELAINGKVDKVTGKGLSANDYTTADKNKVAAIETTIDNKIINKVDKVTGKGLSTNDYTAEEKQKLAGIEAEATAVGKLVGDDGELFNDYETNTATGAFSHAEGTYTTASGEASHAEGDSTTASGRCSHANGYNTIANDYQFASGRFNADTTAPTSMSDTTGSLFVVGCGTSTTARSNALRISAAGKCYGASSFAASGADFAEMFEWQDGNAKNEDRRGLFVTLDGEKIKAASPDDFILGVVSATPTLTGDTSSEEWHDKYKTDVFGEKITKEVENGGVKSTEFVINTAYNTDKEYVSREQRKEWSAIGLIGKLIVIDDGSCKVNGYCAVGKDGKATNAETGYRVLKRIDSTHIRILFR